ncbi:NAD(P)-binding protein [Dentipellis sp. KUC8613]|nr:NAD(P)-binding protein [Dentipellis sp. KUC8613]
MISSARCTNSEPQTCTSRYRSSLPASAPLLPLPPPPVSCSLSLSGTVTSMGNSLSRISSVFQWIDQSFPPKARWTAVDMPDMDGKVAIVTGGNSGIGKETVKELLKKNAKVYMASRSKERCLQAIEDIKAETGKEALFIKLDLSDLASVKQAAEEFLRFIFGFLCGDALPDVLSPSKEQELDILINNGGLMGDPHDVLTAQGYDMQFGSNTLGPFYFTTLLLPALRAAAAKSKQQNDEHSVRVVSVSSASHTMVDTIQFDTLKDSKKRRNMGLQRLYGQSKLGTILFSKELAKRVHTDGIVSLSANPGMIATNIGRNLPYIQGKFLGWLGKSAPQGAITQLWAATSAEAGAHNGAYAIPFARLGKPSPPAEDPKLASDLWAWMEEQVAAFEQSG